LRLQPYSNAARRYHFPQRRVFELIEKNPEVAPGQKCHKLWHFFGVRPDPGQGPHVFEVPRTIPLDSGELYLQVMRQPLDDFGTPTLGSLTLEDFRPIDQWRRTSSLLTANAVRGWASRIRLFRSWRGSG
jgi:hypothetical protein